MKTRFNNADEAFRYFYSEIKNNGISFDNTKALFNVGFYIKKPLENNITVMARNWSKEYALAEWKWYLSGDPTINKLGEIYGKIPKIWRRMADKDGRVNSNYGWQWQREKQLDNVIAMLKQNHNTRQATISIYDGKEINSGNYIYDTPCTYAVQFTIIDNKLNMSVYMRSNDLWYGFCNDQYQFSMLQKMVADELLLPVGSYYHHAHNFHLYNDKI